MAATTQSPAHVMSDEVWRRHAHPLSVITRYSSIPLLIAAIWSRTWLGWWCLVPLTVVVTWIWLNPRLFPVPTSTDNWASKAVLGERVWLNRKAIPIPTHHALAANVLNAINVAGALVLCWGLFALEYWPTALGFAIVFFGKTWFLDRMVWLFEDMMHTTAEYRSWLY